MRRVMGCCMVCVLGCLGSRVLAADPSLAFGPTLTVTVAGSGTVFDGVPTVLSFDAGTGFYYSASAAGPDGSSQALYFNTAANPYSGAGFGSVYVVGAPGGDGDANFDLTFNADGSLTGGGVTGSAEVAGYSLGAVSVVSGVSPQAQAAVAAGFSLSDTSSANDYYSTVAAGDPYSPAEVTAGSSAGLDFGNVAAVQAFNVSWQSSHAPSGASALGLSPATVLTWFFGEAGNWVRVGAPVVVGLCLLGKFVFGARRRAAGAVVGGGGGGGSRGKFKSFGGRSVKRMPPKFRKFVRSSR